jgi:hypothetical protein
VWPQMVVVVVVVVRGEVGEREVIMACPTAERH